MEEYIISRFDNSTIENLAKEQVIENLKKILADDTDNFLKTEILDPVLGWLYAEEWLKEAGVKLDMYGY